MVILIELTNSYDSVYKWFDHLKLKGHKINGYVIMPNHLHVLIEFINAEKKINTIVSNGKRFIAYEIVDRLKNKKNIETLLQLAAAVSPSDSKRGKLHHVFERSFDCKPVTSNYFFQQKLTYIHNNPCSYGN
jgi:REP element-mobilizing transposase RayT